MKSLSYLSLLLMASMFLFLGGCQKEEISVLNSMTSSLSKNVYNPVFDTLSNSQFKRNGSRNFPNQIKSPNLNQFLTMNKNLRYLSLSHPLTSQLIYLNRSGRKFVDSLSIINFISAENSYIISTPIHFNNQVDGVLVYVYMNGEYFFKIYSKDNLDELIQDKNLSPETKSEIKIPISSILLSEFYGRKKLHNTYYFWLQENKEIRNSSIDSRNCYWITITYYIHTYVGSNSEMVGGMEESEEHFSVTEHSGSFVICEELVLTETSDGGPVGGNGGVVSQLDDCMKKNLTHEAQLYVDNILENYTNPCDKNKIFNLIADILLTHCQDPENDGEKDWLLGTTLQNLDFSNQVIQEIDKALEDEDYIVENELKEKCPTLYCLYNKMIQMNNNFVCKYVTPTFDSKKFKLTFKVAEAGSGTSANVTYQGGGEATMTIDPSLCDGDELQTSLMAKLLHEFVHVELARQMSLKGYDINDINSYYKFYNEGLPNYIYNIAATQGQDQIHHNIMLEYDKIIDKIALTLFEMFNGKANGLTVDHFKLAAANGLFEAMQHHQAPENSGFNTLRGYFENKYQNLGAILNSKKLKLVGC